MKDLNNILNHTMGQVRQNESSLLSTSDNKTTTKFISIPIQKDMALYLLNRKKPKEINNLELTLEGNDIAVSGTVKKMGLSINFYVKLRPLEVHGRTLPFKIIELKPLNNPWLNKIILNRPPLSIAKNKIIVDLNQISKLRSIPFVNVRKVEIKENTIWIGLGL